MRTLLATLLLAGLLAPDAVRAASTRFRRMAVVGDSLLAGFGSGGLVARGRTGQVNGAASLVARQAGTRLPLPGMSAPGVPPPLTIVDANHDGILDPGDVRRRTGRIGFRSKPFRDVRNLAVPGEDLHSIFDEIGPDDIAKQLVGNEHVSGRDLLKFLILGLPPDSDSVSQLTRVRDLAPSFVMVWIGSNEVLDMATETDPTRVTLGRPEFADRFRRVLNAIADTGADMAVANLPDVTGVAALRPAAGEITACTGPTGPMAVAADDLLSIDMPRALLPTPPCAKVLDATERAQVRATVSGFNDEIALAVADVAQQRGVGIALVDVFTLFDQIRSAGVDLDGNGTADLSSGYLGGVFSLDGIHPTRSGHGLIANAFIDAIDVRFGETIPRVDVARIASGDALARSAYRPAGQPPFGLIGDDETDDVEEFFTRTYDRVARGADDLRDDFVDRVKHWFGL